MELIVILTKCTSAKQSCVGILHANAK